MGSEELPPSENRTDCDFASLFDAMNDRERSFAMMNDPRARSSADSICKDSARPSKKARVARSEDDECLNAEDLNLKGISNMLSGRDAEAERCFSQALCQLDKSFPARSRLHLPLSRSKSFDITPPTHTPDDEEMGSVKSQKSPTLLYIYQRQEYDEGMYVYKDALPLDEDCSVEDVRSATLLYNVAQTHVRRGTYFEAKKWFELALVRLKLADASGVAYSSSIKMVWTYHNLAHCLYRLGRNDDAGRCYRKARAICVDLKLDSFHVAAANVACGVLLFHSSLRDLDQALDHFTGALPAYRAKYGESSKEVATVQNNVGRVLYLKGNYDEAVLAYEEALAIRRKDCPILDLSASCCNLGQTLHQKGDLEQAMKYYREFLDLATSRLGTNHRDIAIIYRCQGDIHHERGERMQAKEMYEKALAVGKQALGPYSAELTSIWNKLGNLHFELQDLDKALQYYTEGLHVERIVLEPSHHPFILVTLANIAQIHRHRGNFAAALLKYAEIHSLQVKSLGPNALEIAETLSNMGLMEYQLKAFSAAFALYQAALRIQRDHYGTDDHIDIATTLNSIGLILFNQGVYDLAKSCFTDSLRIRTKLHGPDHPSLAVLFYNCATIALETGEDDVALKLYKETLRVEREAGLSHDVILTLQHLGLVYQERGELDEALNYFNEALEIERTRGGEFNVSVGKLLNLMGNIHLRRANVEEMMKCYTEASRLYRNGGLVDESLVIAGYNFYGLSKLHPPAAPTA